MPDLIERIPEGFTPGPWRIKKGHVHDSECCDLTICSDIFLLADINGPNYAHCDPNARLIALAPELAAGYRAQAARVAELEAEVARQRRAATLAGAPLDAIIRSGAIESMSPSLQAGIREGVEAARAALAAPDTGGADGE